MGLLSNAAIIVDSAGRPVTSPPGTALATGAQPQSTVVISGSDYAAAPAAQAPKVDAKGNQYVITTPATPPRMDAAGNQYVLTAPAGQAPKIDAQGNQYVVTTPAGTPPRMDSAGNQYVLTTPAGLAPRMDAAGNQYVLTTPVGQAPKVDAAGNQYVISTPATPPRMDAAGNQYVLTAPAGLAPRMDSAGNQYVLTTPAGQAPKIDAAGNQYVITTPSGQAPRMDAQGDQYVITTPATPDGASAANLLRQPLTTSTGNASPLVNGSVYSQTFYWVPATATASYVITGIYVVMTASALSFAGKYFGGATTLSRGLLLQASQASVLTTLSTITINEDLLGFNGEVTPNLAGATDLLTARLRLQHPIAAGSGDGVQVVVRDNLTAANMPTYLRFYVEGIRLTA